MSKIFTRREFLKTTLTGAACVACSASAWGALGNNIVFAQTPQGSGKILVLVNLFGGIDGLNWVVPYANQVYYDRRPNIAIPASQVLQLNGEVGLNPAWAPLYSSIVPEGRLAVVQQVGYPNANRSHFESQDIWSLGRRSLASGDPRGWLGRLADQYFDSNYDVFGVGVSSRPDFLANRTRPTVVNSLRDFGFQSDWSSGSDKNLRLETAGLNAFSSSSAAGPRMRVKESMKAIYTVGEQLKQIDAEYTSTAVYPQNALGGYLKEIAKLIQSNLGTQVLYTGVGGWDTHSNQTAAQNANLTGVAQAVDAFVNDLKAMGKWQDVCLVFFSEFGRNCFENGSRGTDHGHGNSMILLGGDVQGGVYGPTPSASDLNRDYLDYYIDFRSVFKSVVRSHLGLNPDPVFDEVIPINDASLPLFA